MSPNTTFGPRARVTAGPDLNNNAARKVAVDQRGCDQGNAFPLAYSTIFSFRRAPTQARAR